MVQPEPVRKVRRRGGHGSGGDDDSDGDEPSAPQQQFTPAQVRACGACQMHSFNTVVTLKDVVR